MVAEPAAVGRCWSGPGSRDPVAWSTRASRLSWRSEADQDARLGVDLDVPEFLDVPELSPPEPLRLSEVSSRRPGKMAEARGRIINLLDIK
eukprot:SAG11_NODE_1295_length_5275_cov_3.069165_10_plen_91_part_00